MREEDGRETFAAYELKLLKKKKTWQAGKKKKQHCLRSAAKTF